MNSQSIAIDMADFTVQKIVKIVEDNILGNHDVKIPAVGRERLVSAISRKVSGDRPIEFLLPGYPCKSPNRDEKVFGKGPDFGELHSLSRLDRMCEEISTVYPKGAVVKIFSDGETFSDIVGVADDTVESYRRSIRLLAPSNHIRWFDLKDVFRDAASPEERRSRLMAEYNPGGYDALYQQKISGDERISSKIDEAVRVLEDDTLGKESGGDRSDLRSRACWLVARNTALNNMLTSVFSDEIRLSAHVYDNSGPKYSFDLVGDGRGLSPWHGVPFLREDGEIEQVKKRYLPQRGVGFINFKSDTWLAFEDRSGVASKFRFEVVSNGDFGLLITPAYGLANPSDIPRELTKSLLKIFGFIIIRRCEGLSEDALLTYTEQFGIPYIWHFGAVHKVVPDDNPNGYVHSLEKVPLHWDLSMLPLDHPKVKENPDFTASVFTLYCKKAPVAGEGQTTIVDCREVLRQADDSVREVLRSSKITYNTKMTYFGGNPRTFDLVSRHPWTGEMVLRYQEGSDSKLQSFSQESDDMKPEELRALIANINELCYSKRCMQLVNWQDDDLVIVDNNRTIHGRLPMKAHSASRELWRVQVF